MTAYFLDSSATVKRYVREVGTAWTIEIFRGANQNIFYSARITLTEVVSEFARRLRGKSIKSYELVVDTNKPIISTGDMKAWDTSKPFVHTRKSHINFCVCDSRWESTTALHLDRSQYVTA